jgi:hypothetical protein
LWYDGIDTDRIIAAARALRGARWVEQTEKFAEYLFLTPPQVRLLYHLFTPLRLGGLPVWGDPARSMRERLYEAMSPTVDSTGLAREAFEQAWSEPKEGEHIPARTDFWTKELYGDINL